MNLQINIISSEPLNHLKLRSQHLVVSPQSHAIPPQLRMLSTKFPQSSGAKVRTP